MRSKLKYELRTEYQMNFTHLKKFVNNLRISSTRSAKMTSEYYQNLHENSTGYQENNWLLEEIDEVLKCQPDSLLEIGYGNGKFLRKVSNRVLNLSGVDWAKSPKANNMPSNVDLIVSDVTKDTLPQADLVCSADVLEHFSPDRIDSILEKLYQAGKFNFHVIACYDDRHSHLCVLTPAQWLEKFRNLSSNFRIKKVTHRNGEQKKLICVISNY